MIERSPHFRSRAAAFTLIELVAATALAAILTMTAMVVIVSLRKPPRSVAASRISPLWHEQLREQLTWDLSQAMRMRSDSESILLAGYGSLDPTTREPSHQPVLVKYSFKVVNNIPWLAREQTPLDALSSAGTWTEWIAAGVDHFELLPLIDTPKPDEIVLKDTAADADPPPQPTIPVRFLQLKSLENVPRRVRLKIRFTGRTAPPLDQTLVLK